MSIPIIGGEQREFKNSITLQTSKRNPIKNSQILKLEKTLLFQKQAKDIQHDYPDLKVRTDPSGIYNCHGMTFANRRTGIDDANELRLILHDDNYVEVSMEEALPGDVVLYEEESGDISHSGIVIEARSEHSLTPRIVSKWGDLSEMIHGVNSCPYSGSKIRYYRCQL